MALPGLAIRMIAPPKGAELFILALPFDALWGPKVADLSAGLPMNAGTRKPDLSLGFLAILVVHGIGARASGSDFKKLSGFRGCGAVDKEKAP